MPTDMWHCVVYFSFSLIIKVYLFLENILKFSISFLTFVSMAMMKSFHSGSALFLPFLALCEPEPR